FGYDCLGFKVDTMTGDTNNTSLGDLTGDVTFTTGKGCGAFDYGYDEYKAPAPDTAPVAKVTATPSSVEAGKPVELTSAGTTDAETQDSLDYSWDFGDGGSTKDATGPTATATYATAGTYTVTLLV